MSSVVVQKRSKRQENPITTHSTVTIITITTYSITSYLNIKFSSDDPVRTKQTVKGF